MAYTIGRIIKDVEICMDEIAPNDAELDIEQDDSERKTIIRSKIREAMRFVYANADMNMLEPDEVITNSSDYSLITGVKGQRIITLPDNYLRLVYAKYPSWSRYVGQEDVILWNDKEYSRLGDAYAGASKERPEVAQAWNGKKKTLELYPDVPTESPSVGIMLDPDDVSNDTEYTDEVTMSIPHKCYRAVIYYIAGLVYVTYADQTRSAMMFETANDIIGFTQQAAQQAAQKVTSD